MTAQFGFDDVFASYRAYRSPWVGVPETPPDVFSCIEQGGNNTNVYMSWNGATEHREWKVFGGATRLYPSPVAAIQKTGFERGLGLYYLGRMPLLIFYKSNMFSVSIQGILRLKPLLNVTKVP